MLLNNVIASVVVYIVHIIFQFLWIRSLVTAQLIFSKDAKKVSGRPELSSKDLLLSSHHSWQNSVPWGCGAEGSRFLLAVVCRPPSALEAVLRFLPWGPPNMAMWFLQTLQGRESFCKVEITTTYNTIMRVTLHHYWLKGRNRSCPHSRGD